MRSIEKVIELAKSEVGYLEKASAYDLDSKIGNAGTANYTKYARDVDAIPDLLNGRKQGYAWCTIFFLWLLAQVFGAENVRRLCYLPEKSLAAGCKFAVEYYKAAGAFGKVPTVGAQIFFADGNGVPSHTGIVTGFDSTYVYTIEGNTSGASGVVANGGCVAAKSYRRDYSRIYGYGMPCYAKFVKEEDEMTRTELEELLAQRETELTRKLEEQLGEFVRERITAALRGRETVPSRWAEEELQKAMEAGITDGTRPGGYATREEVAAMVFRSMAAGKKGEEKNLPAEVAAAMTDGSY